MAIAPASQLQSEYRERLIAAITAETDDPSLQAVALKAITGNPSGKSDKGGRWFPSESEEQDCCSSVRGPSRTWPWSLWKHCQSVAHIATRESVDEKALRRVVTRARKSTVATVAA